MHLRTLTLKGFKSFPDRTRLDFGPGVSVVVGPNGSGKSNVTDAVLWAMGEQSPLAVRGQSMQDVIFGGGRGVQPRSAAEVEIVLDNSDGAVDIPFGEISLTRRLDRHGEGEYRLNGARCRLADVVEALSDTGLGKESHSVISQGKVEQVVTSKPRERRLLIEEAAGLGKHRRRRRRAQLKLRHTEENLDRALDVEREARTRLRPLKRQAEAAELHERLERQSLQARLRLAVEAARVGRLGMEEAQQAVDAAHAARAEAEASLQEMVRRRGEAERALAQRSERHDALSRRLYEARTAGERLRMRLERSQAAHETLRSRIAGAGQELEALRERARQDGEEGDSSGRVAALERGLDELERERERELERELAGLRAEAEQAASRVGELQAALEGARAARDTADAGSEAARVALRAAESSAQDARARAAHVGAELAAANQFLRGHAHRPAGGISGEQVHVLGDLLRVEDGCELALAAVLGGRLEGALAADMAEAARLLDRAGPDGALVLLEGAGKIPPAGRPPSESPLVAGGPPSESPLVAGGRPSEGPLVAGEPPCGGARPLVELVAGPAEAVAVASRLLAGAWLVDRLEDLPDGFGGVGVTRVGRIWDARAGEVRQVAEGGAERVLAKRNERDRLIAEMGGAAQAEQEARGEVERALAGVRVAEAECDAAETAVRELERELGQACEEQRRAGWLIEQRAKAPGEGPLAVRRAQLEGELAAERRQAERVERERAQRAIRIEQLEDGRAADVELLPAAEMLAGVLQEAAEAVGVHLEQLAAELAADREAGEQLAARLRECASLEAGVQAQLRTAGEAVTVAEVAAERRRDRAQEAEAELREISGQLEIELPEVAEEELPEPEAQELEGRLQRLARRREQLGPVNPLAKDEYAEALAHVEELERRRGDLERGLRELRTVIRETDRQIKQTFEETFEAAARNFEQLAGEVFPGGGGRLRLVSESSTGEDRGGGDREGADEPAAGTAAEHAGQPADAESAEGESAERAAEAGDGEQAAKAAGEDGPLGEAGEEEIEGVEIEITRAGKSTKRLSLLSGGEKSMTALAFLFAVFLARPCPFYILDEVEAALDDINLERFLDLLRRYANRAQFIVITHQKRTMEAADCLYGVSMGSDGVSKVVSRRLPPPAGEPEAVPELEAA